MHGSRLTARLSIFAALELLAIASLLVPDPAVADGALIFLEEPADVVVTQGRTVLLSAVATGASTPIYQWFRDPDGPGGAVAVELPDETNSTYTIVNASLSTHNAFYAVRATLGTDSVTSRLARVTVNPDTIPPQVLRAVWSDLTTVVVTVDEPLAADPLLSLALDPFSYLAESVDGVDVLFFDSVTLSNSAMRAELVLGLITPRDPLKSYDLRIFGDSVADLFGNFISYPDNIFHVTDLAHQEIVSFSSIWEYDQSGVDPGDWLDPLAPAFPNAGPGLLGRETADHLVPLIQTELLSPSQGSGTVSYYFRTRFFIGDPGDLVGMTMDYYVDDAAVVYLNGVEAHRSTAGARIPGEPGEPVPFGTQPSSGIGDAELIEGIALPIGLLVAGENILSVYNGQAGNSSADVLWGARLTVTFEGKCDFCPPVVPLEPLMAHEYDSVSLISPARVPATYQWVKDGEELAGETGPAIMFSPAVPSDSGMYSVLVTGLFGQLTNGPVRVTIHPDVRPPTVTSAVADLSRTNITVTFTEPVRLETATNAANYQVTVLGSGELLSVRDLILEPGGRSVILRTDPRSPMQNYELAVSNVQDLAENPNTIEAVTVGVALTVLLFSTGHVWSYDERDVDLGTEWRAAGFDDSDWPAGPSILGFEANLPISTPLQQTFPGNAQTTVTYYLRSHFSFLDDPARAALTANLRFDDGFVMYLNGAEVARQGFVGDVSHGTFFTAHESSEVEAFAIGNERLVRGDNVLAVELHQASFGSSDVVWDATLLSVVRPCEIVDPVITANSDGSVTIRWDDEKGAELWASSSVDGFYSNSGETSPYKFTPPPGGAVFFQVVCP